VWAEPHLSRLAHAVAMPDKEEPSQQQAVGLSSNGAEAEAGAGLSSLARLKAEALLAPPAAPSTSEREAAPVAFLPSPTRGARSAPLSSQPIARQQQQQGKSQRPDCCPAALLSFIRAATTCTAVRCLQTGTKVFASPALLPPQIPAPPSAQKAMAARRVAEGGAAAAAAVPAQM